MNEAMQVLLTRRSIRKYKPDMIKEEELQQILEAGMYAPTAMGKQSPLMVVIQDKETMEQLRRMNASVMGNPDMDPFYGAPMMILVLADKNARTCRDDGSLVMGNLMNAAHAVGVGSCWIHRAKEEFESEEGKALLAKWGIEGEYEGIGHCILGYADCPAPEPKPRKEGYVVRV